MKKIKLLFNAIGFDKAIAYTVLSRVIQAGGGLISIALISAFLSKEEQGYFYTFGSILAVQVFFELGLNTIITQYVAHEIIHLTWHSPTEIIGNRESLSRLSSLLHFCVKTFGILSILLLIGLLIAGFIFFNSYHSSSTVVEWRISWVVICIATALMLLINPVLAFLQGLGDIEGIAKIRLLQQTLNIIVIGLILFFRGGLLASGIASIVSFFTLFLCLYFSHRKKLLIYIYKQQDIWKVSYMKEIFPYQYKIALSWISGYLIFQLFNPVLFVTDGPVVAGQMGMTLTALNGVSSLSMSWISTKIPLMSSLIARRKFEELDRIFDKTVLQAFCVNSLLIGVFIGGIYCLSIFQLPIVLRFLPITPLSLLALVTVINQFVFSWATYLRCHKEEPFLVNSIVLGITCGLSTFLLGNYFGLMGIVGGYTALTVFLSFPWAFYLFTSKKKLWHE